MILQARLKKLQAIIENANYQCLLIEDPVSLLYLTGIELSSGKILVTASQADLIVDGRYFERCATSCPIRTTLQTSNAFEKCLQDLSVSKLAFCSDVMSYKSYHELEQLLAPHSIELIPVDNPVAQLRMIKDEEELDLLRKAAQLGSQGYDYVCTLLKEGISELQLANELEIFWKRQGSKGVAFEPIIAFGQNSSMPHYRAGDAILKYNTHILIDIGVNLQHYHSDMTRVVFFGEPHPEIRKIYKIVKEAQDAALARCQPGTTIGDLDASARDYIKAAGYGEQFSHSLGHGVGLQIHEQPAVRNVFPYNQMKLEEGMVITIEPGIYLPGIGGVRLENTVVITATGYEDLTQRPL